MNGITQIKFLAFSIICKRRYINSVLIGSPAAIAKKIGISEYITRTYLNYGLKNGLIQKNKNYTLSSYHKIISHLDVIEKIKHYKFKKEGTFKELIEEILFTIVHVNFKQQKYNIDRYQKYLNLLQTGIQTKSERNLFRRMHKKYGAGKKFLNKIVTGQKHLSNLLGVSQRTANDLLNKWHEEKRIFRLKAYVFISRVKEKVIYKNTIQDWGYCLNFNNGYYRCKGSEICL